MEPKVFLLWVALLTTLDDSPAWLTLFMLVSLGVGWGFGPVYRRVLARRDAAASH